MQYEARFRPQAIKDLKKIPQKFARNILEKIEILQTDLQGDVKKLTNFTPEYRLRVGQYRILFEIEEDEIIIYRVLHRSKSYR
ncbi:MAG: type II toxin-antitoxin system RelE/ParE family toxin [Limnothrix sp. RL_2_0]|nr:type II toxin-antitoxin system RelE/ParE family toxin [Limnothrix sp. RL_2_0]